MPLPAQIRVKLSSEGAEAIAFTQVVVQELSPAELAHVILAVTGKDLPRILQILERGSFVSGGTRYRWERLPGATEADVACLLAPFPDPEPQRAFDARACFKVTLAAPGGLHLELERDAASRTRLLHRGENFWEVLMRQGRPAYATYSYKEQADRYELRLTAEQSAALRAAAPKLAYRTLAAKLAELPANVLVSLFTRR